MGSLLFAGGYFFLVFWISSSTVAAQGGADAAGRKLWCVAKNNAADSALQSAIDWACSAGGADCGPIQLGGACYDPSDIRRTASFVFNDYFLKHGLSDENCNFANSAALTSLNPSHSNCRFPSSSLSSGDGSVNGSVTVYPGSQDFSVSGSESRNWDWRSSEIHLLRRLLCWYYEVMRNFFEFLAGAGVTYIVCVSISQRPLGFDLIESS